MHAFSMRKFSAGILGAILLSAGIALAGTPGVPVDGVVRDGSGHGWPLYARVEFDSASADPIVAFSDPVTGGYTAMLADGTAYTVSVTAVAPGYAPAAGGVTTAGAPVHADWSLHASALCVAPGYEPGTFGPAVFSESFDAGTLPAGWTLDTASGDGWSIASGADPCGQFDGNRTGGSGPYALLNSNCPGFQFDDASLVTPPIDLSSLSSAAVRWANDFINDGVSSSADVDASVDGGATWVNVWHSDATVSGPGTATADLSFAAGHANVRLRFHYVGFFGWWWQVDDVAVGPFACTVVPGGLVVGNVRDANTGLGLLGATVESVASGASATTTADPNQGDGFYSLFASGSGAQDFLASAERHTSLTKNAAVAADGVVRLDFSLAAGLLDAAPRPLSVVLSAGGGTRSLPLTVSNTGTGDGSFVLHEVDVAPPAAPAPVRPTRLTAEERLALRRRMTLRIRADARPAAGLPALPHAPVGVPRASGSVGSVVSSFAPGLAGAYGLAYDTDTSRLWLSNSDAAQAGLNGDGLDDEFQPDGTPTGATIDLAGASSAWQGDGTYDARTGMIWQTGVAFLPEAPGQCLFEIDPTSKTVTGHRICGPWQNFPGLTGLAYDDATDTFYAGDQFGVITHVDMNGNVLDSGSIGVQISGLAYNPTTRHLFVQTFSMVPFDTYVVAPAEGYRVLSGFPVTANGSPVLNAGGVSLEADCFGRLWTYDINQGVVLQYESGETGWCVGDIPWLSEDPVSGTVPGSGAGVPASIDVTFDSAGLAPGLYLRSLVFTTDTPDPVAPVPVDFTVLFADVPEGGFAWNFIYGAAGAGVMPGCAPQAPVFSFCPAQIVTRRSMAGFLERAMHGPLTPPPVYQGQFDDVLLGSSNSDYIEGLVDDAVTAGCSVSPRLYCPDVPVTRAQMAVFVWKAQHGLQAPPSCTGVFADVACPGGFAVDYIEAIAGEGVTAGCGGGNYCPNAGITNAQMAVFMVKAFQIPYAP